MQNQQLVVVSLTDLESIVRKAVADALAEHQRPQSEDPPAMLDLDAAGQLVGLHRWQIRDAVKRGELEAFKPVGTRLRIDRADLLLWARRRRA